MKRPRMRLIYIAVLTTAISCSKKPVSETLTDAPSGDTTVFPRALVSFEPYAHNAVFTGTGGDTWDEKIRERGYILREDDGYHLWYTGYRNETRNENKFLGYATSPDGITWTRYEKNPIHTQSWVEDMMVVNHDDLYYMFAEGRGDIAHMLTSTDKVNWEDHGRLDIRQANGEPLAPGPYGTPTVYVEDGTWYLFYERNDEGIWVATSRDLKAWRNVRDEPVIETGPEPYDNEGVALNQVIREGDFYYAYYHGTPTADWSEWNTNVAVSKDLVSWKKYPNNPILEDNKSSAILVHDGTQYRLYAMHNSVNLYLPRRDIP